MEGQRRRAAAQATEVVGEPWNLPDGWQWKRLCETISRRATKIMPGCNSTAVFVGLESIAPGTMEVGETVELSSMRSAASAFEQNDVLYGRLRPYLNKVWVADFRGACSGELLVLTPGEGLLPKYLGYYLHSQHFVYFASHAVTGDRPRIDFDQIAQFLIPVPPAEVQTKIVARVRKLTENIEEGEVALSEAHTGLDTYRKSLLTAAILGRLSDNWRTSNNVSETGDLFLRRLDAEGVGRKQLTLFDHVQNHLPDLPHNWIWTTLGRLLWKIDAGLNVKCHGRLPSDGEFGIVKISAVTWDHYDEDESKTPIRQESLRRENLINPGDLLFSRANTLELVGAPVVVKETKRNLLLSDKVLRLCMPDVLKKWIYFVLKSPHGRREIESRSSGNQLGMRNIPQEGIRSIRIPIPPPEEMNWILDRLEDVWNLNGAFSRSLSESLGVDKLRQSVLNAAFRGELVA